MYSFKHIWLFCKVLSFIHIDTCVAYNWCVFQRQGQFSVTNNLLLNLADCCKRHDCEGIWMQTNQNGTFKIPSTGISGDADTLIPFVKRVLNFKPRMRIPIAGQDYLLAGGFKTNREIKIMAEPRPNWIHIAFRLYSKSTSVMRVDVRENKDGFIHQVLVEGVVKENTDRFWRNVEPRPADPFPFVTAEPFVLSFVSWHGYIEVWIGEELYSHFNVSSTADITKCTVLAHCYVHQFTFIDWDKIKSPV